MDQKIEEYVKRLGPLEAQINGLLVDMAKDGILPHIMTYQEKLVSDTATMIEISIAPIPDRRKTGAYLIAAERARQVSEEGWTPEHDAAHVDGDLIEAAVAYALHSCRPDNHIWVNMFWPWGQEWWKPGDPVRNLAKAGALIAADIDRRLRIKNQKGTKGDI
jgi:hypothetical protein